MVAVVQRALADLDGDDTTHARSASPSPSWGGRRGVGRRTRLGVVLDVRTRLDTAVTAGPTLLACAVVALVAAGVVVRGPRAVRVSPAGEAPREAPVPAEWN